MNSINPFWQNAETSVAQQYLDALSLIERLHRLLLDVIKDEFERLGVLETRADLSSQHVDTITKGLKSLERFWTDQIRYIY